MFKYLVKGPLTIRTFKLLSQQPSSMDRSFWVTLPDTDIQDFRTMMLVTDNARTVFPSYLNPQKRFCSQGGRFRCLLAV